MPWFKKHLKHTLIIGLLMVVSLGCSSPAIEQPPTNRSNNSPTSTGNPPTKPSQVNLAGFIQKGPFILGSEISIRPLNENLDSVGTNFTTQTTDDFGAFSLSSVPTADPLEIVAEGFYFNEVSGSLTRAPISLRALAEIGLNTQLNVNVLTTLAINRIRTLVGQGGSLSASKLQAENEVLAAFHILGPGIAFENMDISQQGDANAMLLAVSAILQRTHSRPADLMEFIAEIGQDIADNGALDDQGLRDSICESSRIMDLQQIRSNLERRYTDLGLSSVQIPRFEDFIDSNCNGVINRDDASATYLWKRAELQPWSNRDGFSMLSFNGRLWVLGGQIQNAATPNNEIWSTIDGDTWTQTQTTGTIWPARINHGSFVFNNRMWIVGGRTSLTGPTADGIWNSLDGTSWRRVADNPSPLGIIAVFNNQIWNFIPVAAPQTAATAYSSPDGITWTRHTLNIGLTASFSPKAVVHNGRIWMLGVNDGMASSLPTHDAAYSSADGVNWRLETADLAMGNLHRGQAYSYRNKLWYVGSSAIYITQASWQVVGSTWSSTDGITWTEETELTQHPDPNFTALFNDRIYLYATRDAYRMWFLTDYAHY